MGLDLPIQLRLHLCQLWLRLSPCSPALSLLGEQCLLTPCWRCDMNSKRSAMRHSAPGRDPLPQRRPRRHRASLLAERDLFGATTSIANAPATFSRVRSVGLLVAISRMDRALAAAGAIG